MRSSTHIHILHVSVGAVLFDYNSSTGVLRARPYRTSDIREHGAAESGPSHRRLRNEFMALATLEVASAREAFLTRLTKNQETAMRKVCLAVGVLYSPLCVQS